MPAQMISLIMHLPHLSSFRTIPEIQHQQHLSPKSSSQGTTTLYTSQRPTNEYLKKRPTQDLESCPDSVPRSTILKQAPLSCPTQRTEHFTSIQPCLRSRCQMFATKLTPPPYQHPHSVSHALCPKRHPLSKLAASAKYLWSDWSRTAGESDSQRKPD